MTKTVKTYNLLQQLLAHTPDIVFFKDRDSRYIEFNDALLKLTGVPREVLLGNTTASFLPRALTEQIIRDDRAVMDSRTPARQEQWVEFADGRLALMDTILAPIVDDDGEVTGLLGIGRDITELMNTSLALKEKNLALEQANHDLDSLMYHAAHDLRAPLNSLMGLIEVMRQEDDMEQMRRYLDVQAAKIQRLDTFIQDIVNLSKNSQEGITLSEIDLENLFFTTVEQFRFLPGAAKMHFDYAASGSVVLRSDAFRLSMVLSNLISNAVRYHDPAKEAPSLRMIVYIDADKAILRLQDNGLGIAQEHLDRIFEMFYRASKSPQGSGIGLYIAKETLQKIGGTMQVESELGQGTTFVIELPNHLTSAQSGN